MIVLIVMVVMLIAMLPVGGWQVQSLADAEVFGSEQSRVLPGSGFHSDEKPEHLSGDT